MMRWYDRYDDDDRYDRYDDDGMIDMMMMRWYDRYDDDEMVHNANNAKARWCHTVVLVTHTRAWQQWGWVNPRARRHVQRKARWCHTVVLAQKWLLGNEGQVQ